METGKVIQGRCITAADSGADPGAAGGEPRWNRSRLSRELCERWDWRNEKGRLKDMAARTLAAEAGTAGRDPAAAPPAARDDPTGVDSPMPEGWPTTQPD